MLGRFLISVLVCTFSVSAFAADASRQTTPASPAAAGSAQEFAKLSKEFNDLIARLTELQGQYAAADSTAKKDQIKKEYDPLRAKAAEMADQVVAAAENAYRDAPNADLEVIEVLVGSLFDQIDRDDYEPAFRLGKMLMDNKCPKPRVQPLAGIAAYCVNEYDLAEPWLKAAKASGSLNRVCDEIKQMDRAEQPRYYLMYADTIDEAKADWAKEKKIRDAEAKIDELYAKATSDAEKAELAKQLNPRVLLKTSKGDIVIELFENEAPNSVLNFITLVEKGYYDGLKFHRVLPGFMAQGGDPKGTGSGGPGYTIPCECYRPDYRLHFRGTLSMAHAGRDTGGSQFFLTFVPTPHLNGKHTAFGRVVSGFDVLAKLKRIDPEISTSAAADKIIEAKVLRKRPHAYDATDVKKSSTHD